MATEYAGIGLFYEAAQAGTSSLDWQVDPPIAGREFCPSSGGCYGTVLRPTRFYDIVHISLGTNDATGAFDPAPATSAQYETRMRALIALIQAEEPGVPIILSTPPYTVGWPAAVNNLIDEYHTDLQTIIGDTSGVEAGCDFRAELTVSADYYEPGGVKVHPSEAGYVKMRDCVEPIILQAIEDL